MKQFLFIAFAVLPFFAKSQTASPYTSRFYGAWGYNKEWYSKSTIKISQPDLQNDYRFNRVVGHDHIGWDKLFHTPVTIPQYNYRLGFFFKKNPSWGFELNFDHTKYQMTEGQSAHITGTFNGEKVDTNMVIVDSVNFWKLNNGANFFCFNIMKRFYLAGTKNSLLKFYALFKLGVGPVIPHPENTLMGHKNKPGFQFGGFDAGLEAAYRLEIGKYVYIDLAQKADAADYFGLHVYEGTAKQSFLTYELIGSVGLMLPFK